MRKVYLPTEEMELIIKVLCLSVFRREAFLSHKASEKILLGGESVCPVRKYWK